MAIEEANTSIVAPAATTEDETLDSTLRPKLLDEFTGQAHVKQSLQVFLEAAKQRGDSLEHVLLAGPPGLGKTSLAHIIARELGSNIRITAGPVLTKVADLAAILTNLQKGDVLFIDEIHRLNRSIEEVLYPAMESYALDLVVGQGPGAKTLRIDLPQFTLIGATTRVGMLGAPLRDRFGMSYRLDFYPDEELQLLVMQKAKMLNFLIEEEAALEIARRSRMTARIAIRILKRALDFATVENKNKIDTNIVLETLKLLNIGEDGLNETDRLILTNLIANFDNLPVGLNTLAASITEEPETLETVYEPFLLKKGLIKRTSRGRQATNKAVELYNDSKLV